MNDSGCPPWLEKLDNEPFSIIWLETIGFFPALAGIAGIFFGPNNNWQHFVIKNDKLS